MTKRFYWGISPDYGVDHLLFESCFGLGFNKENIMFLDEFKDLSIGLDIIYVSEGNTFEILDYIRKSNQVEFIHDQILNKGVITHYEPHEFANYIANSEKTLIKQYEKIYSVSNDSLIVL